MKRALVLLSFCVYTLAATNAFAKCRRDPVWVSPKSSAILPANASVFVALSGQAKIVFEKKAKQKFFFKSGKEKIRAKLVWERDYLGLKALYLRATKNLKVGKSYSLLVNGEKFTWKIGKADTTKPKWIANPKVISFTTGDPQSDGVGVSFTLSLDVRDASPVFYDIVMNTKRHKGLKKSLAKKSRFIATASEGKMFLDNGMCSSHFVPDVGEVAQVEMTPYDFAGNKGETKTFQLSAKVNRDTIK